MKVTVGTIRMHWVLEDGSKFFGTYEEGLAREAELREEREQ